MTCKCMDVLGIEAKEAITTVGIRLRATTTALCTVLVILCTCDVTCFL